MSCGFGRGELTRQPPLAIYIDSIESRSSPSSGDLERPGATESRLLDPPVPSPLRLQCRDLGEPEFQIPREAGNEFARTTSSMEQGMEKSGGKKRPPRFTTINAKKLNPKIMPGRAGWKNKKTLRTDGPREYSRHRERERRREKPARENCARLFLQVATWGR